MILSVTLNPSVDQTLYISGFKAHDTNRIERVEVDAGGKGVNLSRVAAELGASSAASGFIGGRTGDLVLEVLAKQGVIDEFVRSDNDTRTVWSIESGDGPPTTFNESGAPVSKDAWEALCAKVSDTSASCAWVALGGSLPKGVPSDAYLQLAKIARSQGAKVLIDADGDALQKAMEFGPDLVKPNSPEAGRLLNRTVSTEAEAIQAAEDIRAMLTEAGNASATVIVSRGAEGAVMASPTGVKSYRAFKVEVRSTIGSGDSMLGGFLAGRQRGLDDEACMRLALAAGAATAMSDGTQIGRRADIERIFSGS